MSDLVIDPDQVHAAARSLFDVSDALFDHMRTTEEDSTTLRDAVNTFEFRGVAEVVEAGETWARLHIPRHRQAIEEEAQFLAVHAGSMVEVDEYNAEMFYAEADPALYPVDPDSRSTPVPDPPEPIHDEVRLVEGQ